MSKLKDALFQVELIDYYIGPNREILAEAKGRCALDILGQSWKDNTFSGLSASNGARQFLHLLLPNAPSTLARFLISWGFEHSKICSHFCHLLFKMRRLLWVLLVLVVRHFFSLFIFMPCATALYRTQHTFTQGLIKTNTLPSKRNATLGTWHNKVGSQLHVRYHKNPDF